MQAKKLNPDHRTALLVTNEGTTIIGEIVSLQNGVAIKNPFRLVTVSDAMEFCPFIIDDTPFEFEWRGLCAVVQNASLDAKHVDLTNQLKAVRAGILTQGR